MIYTMKCIFIALFVFRNISPHAAISRFKCLKSLRGPCYWVKSTGSVNALKKSSRGASNSRVMTISCLPGSAVIFVLFFVIFIRLLSCWCFYMFPFSAAKHIQSIDTSEKRDSYNRPVRHILWGELCSHFLSGKIWIDRSSFCIIFEEKPIKC